MDSEGKIRLPKIIRSSLPDLNIEAMRLLIESDNWQPARQNKVPVPYRMTLTIEMDDPDKPERYYIVDEMPKFSGGDPVLSFQRFIAENLRYPEQAAEKGIKGRVIVQFTVMSDGSVDEIHVVRSIHPLLDAEAMRVISTSPKWAPGKLRGSPVGVIYTFPINFVLE